MYIKNIKMELSEKFQKSHFFVKEHMQLKEPINSL